MAQAETTSNFPFVDWSQISGPRKDPATRLLIRKQAMSKAAAARKERGDWGKKTKSKATRELDEPRQRTEDAHRGSIRTNIEHRPKNNTTISPPTENHATTELAHAIELEEPPIGDEEWSVPYSFIPMNMPCKDYEMMRIDSDFDLLDLSALTTFHVGRITTMSLHSNPAQLASVLQCRQWSYFSYLPARWGFFPCLDDAARCVASRVRHWLSGDIDPLPQTRLLYSKALISLQTVLNDPILCMEPEVLCAIEILSIHELLDNYRDYAWTRHAAGARSLLKLRGPQRFESRFERSLFLAQMGPINTEALIEDRACFLEEEEWFRVFQIMVAEPPPGESTFSDCGVAVVSLWAYLSSVPGIYHDVQEVICRGTFPEERTIFRLKRGINFLDESICNWRSVYEPTLLDPSSEASGPMPRSEKRHETLAVCLTMLVILRRLRVALDPLGSSHLEEQAQQFAARIQELGVLAIRANPRAALFMAFKKEVANATLQTKDDWVVTSLLDIKVGANGLIAPRIFKRWCELKGRACS